MSKAVVTEEHAVSNLQFVPGAWKNMGQIAGEFRDAAALFYRSGAYGELDGLLCSYADKITPSQFVRLFLETFKTIKVPYVLDFCEASHKAALFKCVDVFRRHSHIFSFEPKIADQLDWAQYEVNRDRDWLNLSAWWKPFESVEDWLGAESEMVKMAA